MEIKNIYLICPIILGATMIGCTSKHQTASDFEKPNVILILADDLGYSDIGCFGSEINTPNLDRLAENGIRFTQAYNHGVCYPSRAALLTGAYAHQVGMINGPRKITNAITLGHLFRMAGYSTLWSGKHHGTQNPTDLGFDEYYGLRDGCCNYFNPGDQRPGEGKPARKEGNYPRKWIKDGKLLEPYTPDDPNFYTTNYFADYAVMWLDEYGKKDKPFFLYLAFTAPHDPLMAFPEDIQKYLGKYMTGYAEIRKARFLKQKQNGLLNEVYHLSEPTFHDWESLPEEEKLKQDSTMAVYAAMIDKMDENIGRVLTKVKELGKYENTLVMFASDNGAAHQVVTMEDYGPIGSITKWTSLGPDWANVANTPLRKSKVYSHEGGIRTPLIASWAAGINNKGRVDNTPIHFIDFMPTFAEIINVTPPVTLNGQPVTPIQGISILPIFKDRAISRGNPIYQQLQRGKALREGQWKIVCWNEQLQEEDNWELYNFDEDPVEMKNLINSKPEISYNLIQKHDTWMSKVSK